MMEQFRKILFALSFIVIFLYQNEPFRAAEPLMWEEKTTQDVNKSWTVYFNENLRLETVSQDSIYIADLKNKRIPVTVKVANDQRSITVSPNQEYKVNTKYWLYVDESVRSLRRDPLKQSVWMLFTVEGNKAAATSNASTENTIDTDEESNLKVSVGHHDYFANIKVITSEEVASVKIGKSKMQYIGNNTFTLGLAAVEKGDKLNFKAYGSDNKMIERKTYTVK